MIKIIDRILPAGHSSRPGGKYKKTTVTIHETGNASYGAGAYNHALYASRRTDKLGVQYYVDDLSVYRTIPDEERSNHCGNTVGNKTSISIEICINPDSDFITACINAAELTAMLLKKYNLSVEDIRQHYDWNKKNCPANLRRSGWKEFLLEVQDKLDIKEEPKPMQFDNIPATWAKESVDWAVANKLLVGDSKGDLKLRDPLTREQMCVLLKRFHDTFIKP